MNCIYLLSIIVLTLHFNSVLTRNKTGNVAYAQL